MATVLEELGKASAPKRECKTAAQEREKLAEVEVVEEHPAVVEVVEEQRPAQAGRAVEQRRIANNAKKKEADAAAEKGKKRKGRKRKVKKRKRKKRAFGEAGEVQKKKMSGGPEKGDWKKRLPHNLVPELPEVPLVKGQTRECDHHNQPPAAELVI
ncbi:hypothetical protein EX30DRAFT_374810 [Ascodesmis nigricans]|uniref:Uncharacterized protein n=1 Tax=Ascodesmis nigricans TaxID=341454 RepID=A0A4S2MPQ3_9PEZI|nr:hypothetical protein EX30DRAFT_374810 [Ascodesmis nigricans]